MSIIGTLVTDRTQTDVERADYLNSLWVQHVWTGTPEELAEWEAGPKGAYNASDLNRVQEAMEYLAGVFDLYGYTVALQAVQTWADGNMPTASDMSVYLSNLSELRGVLDVLPTCPDTPESMELLTYIEANNIEEILVNIDLILNAMGSVFLRAGMPWAVAGNEVYVKNA